MASIHLFGRDVTWGVPYLGVWVPRRHWQVRPQLTAENSPDFGDALSTQLRALSFELGSSLSTTEAALSQLVARALPDLARANLSGLFTVAISRYGNYLIISSSQCTALILQPPV
jgi:hypothetical protein